MWCWSILDGLVKLGVVLGTVWLIFFKRYTDAWLLQKLERGAISPAPLTHAPVPDTWFFPVSTCIAVTLSLAIVLLMATASVLAALRTILVGGVLLTVLGGPPLAFAALYCHYARRSSRRAKYELALSALAVAIPTYAIGNTAANVLVTFNVPVTDTESWHQLFLLIGSFEIFFAVYFIVVQYVVRGIVRRGVERNRLRGLYSLTQSRILWFLGVFCSPYLVAHTLMRFHLVPLIEKEPILFFRTFRNPSLGVVYEQIVARAARRIGIVHGLAHITQPPSSLQAGLDFSDEARLEVVQDQEWKSWVLERLAHARAVIVEASVESESLRWEIDSAIERVGASRVAVLVRKGLHAPQARGVWICEYTIDRRGQREARRKLRQWLDHIYQRSLL